MSITAPTAAPGPSATIGARLRALRISRPRPELLALLVLAGVLNLWSLSRNGWANEYYSAAVRSMSTSWHAFLYNSFDASGVMTVDKPPLSMWVQALSARIFGFSSWSILVPQALMGVASVALVYDIARRRFGRVAGGVAGLALALTPITVAVSRHNNPDALLVLCVVAALWFAMRALETGRTRDLVWAGVCVGLGFETKMGAALLVVPALAAAYLWVAPRGRVRALGQLLAGGAAMTVVGLAWPVLVWLTPAGSRPWVSGTSDNSIWSLILDYNGVGRLDGQAGGPGGGPGGGGGGGGFFGGSTGPLRLLNEALGGQAGWLLGLAVAGGLAIVVASRLRRSDARAGWIVAVGGAFLTTAVAFSFASGIFHPYYVSELAPFTALLVGAGVAQLASGDIPARILAPVGVLAGVLAERKILGDSGSLGWLAPVLAAGGVAAATALAVTPKGRARNAVLGAAVALLLVAPASWSAQTLGYATSSTFPAGGPAGTGMGGGPGGGPGGMRTGRPPAGAMPGGTAGAMPGGMAGGPPAGMPGTGGTGAGPTGFGGAGGPFGGNGATTEAVAYAKAHGGGSVAVSGQNGAGTAVINGQNVVALGGFSGRESQVSLSWLADAVRSGKVRWVLADSQGGAMPNDSRTGSREAMSVVASTCKAVTLASGTTLYDCQGSADALAAQG